MNALATFEFNGKDLHPFRDQKGTDWFLASEVCRHLEIENNRDALSRLDDDEKGVVLTDTLGGPQKLAAVNESGLYSLALSSRKPSAKPFKRWITHEVLPALRRTGSYQMTLPLQGKKRGRKSIGDVPKETSLTVRMSAKTRDELNTIVATTGVSATRFIERAIDTALKPVKSEVDEMKLLTAKRLAAKEKRLATELCLRTLRTVESAEPMAPGVYASAAAKTISSLLVEVMSAAS